MRVSEPAASRSELRNRIDLGPLLERNRAKEDAGRKRARFVINELAALLLEFLRVEQAVGAKLNLFPNAAMPVLHTVPEPLLLGSVETKLRFAKANFLGKNSGERAAEQPL